MADQEPVIRAQIELRIHAGRPVAVVRHLGQDGEVEAVLIYPPPADEAAGRRGRPAGPGPALGLGRPKL